MVTHTHSHLVSTAAEHDIDPLEFMSHTSAQLHAHQEIIQEHLQEGGSLTINIYNIQNKIAGPPKNGVKPSKSSL